MAEKKDQEEIGIQRRADHHLNCEVLRTGTHRYKKYRNKTSILSNFVLVCSDLLAQSPSPKNATPVWSHTHTAIDLEQSKDSTANDEET